MARGLWLVRFHLWRCSFCTINHHPSPHQIRVVAGGIGMVFVMVRLSSTRSDLAVSHSRVSCPMERGESILDAIFDGVSLEDVQDVEMMDVEEGELVLQDSQSEFGQPLGGDDNTVNQESVGKNRRRTKKKKKKNRSEKASSGPKVTDINRFVTNICKCLRERKTYLVYTAVGCLGVSALSDLVKEVSAIQACGGQKTADGRRFRNGGGILWNVLKSRDPNAYKEIMTRGKEFEKQFKQQITRQNAAQNKEASSERKGHALMNRTIASSSSDGLQIVPNVQNQLELSGVAGNRKSVNDRLRAPISYDDLPQ